MPYFLKDEILEPVAAENEYIRIMLEEGILGLGLWIVFILWLLTRHSAMGFEVFTYGGRTATGVDAIEWAARAEALGAGEVLLTSMDRDGTRDGFDIPLTRAISERVNIPVIASGGVGSLDHLVEGVREGKADAVLAASIFHFGEHTVHEAKQYLAAHDITVRP